MSYSKYEFFSSKPNNEKRSIIFSKDAIAAMDNPYVLADGRVTGYNLLGNNQWLIRTSAQLGALTIDHRKDGIFFSERLVLEAKGWTLYQLSTGPIQTDPNVALEYSEQLKTFLDSHGMLEGLAQVFPPANLSAVEVFYSPYVVRVS